LCADDVVFTQGALSTFLAGPTKGKPEKEAAGDVGQEVLTADEPAKAAPAQTEGVSAKAADDEEDAK
jgi:hypothetical protein